MVYDVTLVYVGLLTIRVKNSVNKNRFNNNSPSDIKNPRHASNVWLFLGEVKYWMQIFTLHFEVAVRVWLTLETLTLILRPQSAIFFDG